MKAINTMILAERTNEVTGKVTYFKGSFYGKQLKKIFRYLMDLQDVMGCIKK